MKTRCIALAICLLATPAVGQESDNAPSARKVPPVEFSDQHQQMVKVGVGNEFPDVSLPTAAQPTDPPQPLAKQLGSKATVVAVYKSDSPMSLAMLRDLHFDIRDHYDPQAGDVATLAIASGMDAGKALEEATKAKYGGRVLLDQDVAATDQLGTGRMPRVFVLDSAGKVVWLDIEYSQSTRRDLKQAVLALAGKPSN